jgi:hypothetical protein
MGSSTLKYARAIGITQWAERVQYVDATYAGKWELPVLGEMAAPDDMVPERVISAALGLHG